MSESLPKKPKTVTRVNSRGLIEVLCAHTGRLLCLQSSPDSLFERKWERLTKIETPDGPVWLERGLNFDLTKMCKGMPYSSTLAGLLLNHVASGMSLMKACDELSLSYSDVLLWKRQSAEFRDNLDEAKLERADFARELIHHIGEERGNLDALKWSAEKGNPEKYGPRIKHSGDKNSPLSFVLDTGIRRPGDDGYQEPEDVSPVGIEDGGSSESDNITVFQKLED